MPRLFRPQDRTLNHRVHIQLLMVVAMNRQSPSAGTSPHQIRSTELLRKRNSKSFGQEANCMLFGARYIIRMFSEKITTPDFADILKTTNSATGPLATRVTTATDILRYMIPASASTGRGRELI